MPTYVFGIDAVTIQNQKADSDHSDNDWLTLAWSVANPVTKSVQTFKKTLRVGGVLHSGDVVHGPFAPDPITLGDDDILTMTMVLVNLGSSDTEDQFQQAVQVTDKVVGAVGPIVGGIIGTLAAGNLQAGVQIGGAVAKGLDTLIGALSDIFDFLNIHIGPANCNGEVLHDTFTYTASDLRQSLGQAASRTYAGPQSNGRCGAPPHTQVDFSMAALAAGSQGGWRSCPKCQGLHFAGFPDFKGVCPAGGQHDQTSSFGYLVMHDGPLDHGQDSWRSCPKCQGLHFAGFPDFKGVCPAGGQHEQTGSFAYVLAHDAAPQDHVQVEWRSCRKCQGLFYGPFGGVCPAGGAHDATGSFNYNVSFE